MTPNRTHTPGSRRGLSRHLPRLALAAALALSGSSALADTIWSKPTRAGATPLARQGLRIQDLDKDGNLVFRVVSSDRQDTKPLDDIYQIKLDSDPVFSGAEAAFVAGEWQEAATGYQKALAASRVNWVKRRSVVRLVQAAAKAGNFPVVARAYAELVKSDPAAATRNRPEIPAGRGAAADLSAADAEVERVISAGGLSAEQVNVLRTFQLTLARAAGNTKRGQEIAAILGNAPADQAGGGDARGKAAQRIALAEAALEVKDYPKALKQITDGEDSFTEPEQQVTAYFCRAEAKAGMARTNDALQDAALDYMRTVARAKSAGLKSPRIPESLLKTAGILEKVGAPKEALALYQQIATEFKGSAAEQAATEGAARATAAIKQSEQQS